MRKVILTLMAIALSVALYSQDGEKEAIRKVIQEAYVDGLQNKGDLEVTARGFHEGFDLLGVRDNMLTRFPIYSWISYAEKKKEKDPSPPSKDELVTAKFPMIDVTGNAAVGKVELYRNDKQIFTDYLSLYKFEEGWRIVSKIYYQIPE